MSPMFDQEWLAIFDNRARDILGDEVNTSTFRRGMWRLVNVTSYCSGWRGDRVAAVMTALTRQCRKYAIDWREDDNGKLWIRRTSRSKLRESFDD